MPPDGGLLVVSAVPPAVRAPADLAALPAAADLVELRLDLLLDAAPDVDVAAWVAAAPRPVLATVRSRAQGGLFAGSPEEAARLLEAAAAAGAAWVDVEARVAPCLGALPAGTRRLLSVHGLPLDDEPPPAGEHVKLARPVDDAPAFARLQGEAAALPAGAFVVPYGRLAATRTLFAGPGRGGLLFGAATADGAAAPGQPPLAELLGELRAGEVTARAALHGLVGSPPSRSPSPALHNAVFRARELDALYVPLPGLGLDEALGLPLEGLSVTTPFKARALELADALDATARSVGAVNTLVRRADGWWGGNTDATALRALLPPASPGASACVLGAGGYARAAVWALRARGYDVRIVARHDLRGRVAADTTGARYAGTRYQRGAEDAVVVHATPAGADGHEVEALAGAALGGLTVLDAPYAAPGTCTGVVAQARRQGAARIVDGHALLVAQARDQAIAFGADPAALDLDRILALALAPPPSLVLLGTRGAGKSTVGRAVARRLGRPFLDLDDEVERTTGRSPAAWIERDGWETFRRVECATLERAAARSGIVLATGGGVVTHAASRRLLARAGVRVHLAVDAATAAARVAASPAARPPVPGAGGGVAEAARLLEERTPLLRDLADHDVDANRALSQVVEDVVRCWIEQPNAS